MHLSGQNVLVYGSSCFLLCVVISLASTFFTILYVTSTDNSYAYTTRRDPLEEITLTPADRKKNTTKEFHIEDLFGRSRWYEKCLDKMTRYTLNKTWAYDWNNASNKPQSAATNTAAKAEKDGTANAASRNTEINKNEKKYDTTMADAEINNSQISKAKDNTKLLNVNNSDAKNIGNKLTNSKDGSKTTQPESSSTQSKNSADRNNTSEHNNNSSATQPNTSATKSNSSSTGNNKDRADEEENVDLLICSGRGDLRVRADSPLRDARVRLVLFTTMYHSTNMFSIFNNTLTNWAALMPDLLPVLYLSDVQMVNRSGLLLDRACALGWVVAVAPGIIESGYPVLRNMFSYTKRLVQAPWIGFANGDILFTPDLPRVVLALEHRQRIGPDGGRQRIEPDFQFISSQRYNALIKLNTVVGSMAEVYELARQSELAYENAIDYFIYRYDCPIIDTMPDFVIGRRGFDNWLVYAALAAGLASLDITRISPAVHQGIRGYSEWVNSHYFNKVDFDYNIYLTTGENWYERGHVFCMQYQATGVGDMGQEEVRALFNRTGMLDGKASAQVLTKLHDGKQVPLNSTELQDRKQSQVPLNLTEMHDGKKMQVLSNLNDNKLQRLVGNETFPSASQLNPDTIPSESDKTSQVLFKPNVNNPPVIVNKQDVVVLETHIQRTESSNNVTLSKTKSVPRNDESLLFKLLSQGLENHEKASLDDLDDIRHEPVILHQTSHGGENPVVGNRTKDLNNDKYSHRGRTLKFLIENNPKIQNNMHNVTTINGVKISRNMVLDENSSDILHFSTVIRKSDLTEMIYYWKYSVNNQNRTNQTKWTSNIIRTDISERIQDQGSLTTEKSMQMLYISNNEYLLRTNVVNYARNAKENIEFVIRRRVERKRQCYVTDTSAVNIVNIVSPSTTVVFICLALFLITCQAKL